MSASEVTIFIEELEFYAYHGVPDEERIVGHRYVVDLEIKAVSSAQETDCIRDTVDYGTVSTDIVRLATSTQVKTVERLAGLILDDLFERYPAILAARLRVAKIAPPAPVIARVAGVEVHRSRLSN